MKTHMDLLKFHMLRGAVMNTKNVRVKQDVFSVLR